MRREVRRALLRLAALVLVIEVDRDRVVGVVGLDHEVGDGELELIDPQPLFLLTWSQVLACAQKEKNIGGLADEELAAFEERRREWRMRDAPAVEQRQHRRHAVLAGPARDVDIIGAGCFERQAHEFAAPLDVGPVIELIAHEDHSPRGRDILSSRASAGNFMPVRSPSRTPRLLTSRSTRTTLGRPFIQADGSSSCAVSSRPSLFSYSRRRPLPRRRCSRARASSLATAARRSRTLHCWSRTG